MSILCTLYLRDGIILASESRATHSIEENGQTIITGRTDDLQKTFVIEDKRIGISFCDNAKVGNMLMDDFFEMFIRDHVKTDYTIETISEILRVFFKDRRTQMVLAGYKDGVPYVYKIAGGLKKFLNRQDDKIIFGMEVRGLYDKTCEYFEKEIQPHIIFGKLTIEEGIGLAKDLIQYAINNEEGCGGDINILIIKPDSVAWCEKADYSNKNSSNLPN